jgi:hypothetical protein
MPRTSPDLPDGRRRAPRPLPREAVYALIALPPLVLAIWEIFHPSPAKTMEGALDQADWFYTFHLIQLPLLGLAALSVYLLADTFGWAQAWTTRIGVGLFAIFYPAYDVMAGFASGLAMSNAQDLPPEQQTGVWEAVREWPRNEDLVVRLGDLGTLGWIVGVGGLAWGARRFGAPVWQWVLLIPAALLLVLGHPWPFGTVAFGCLFVVAAARVMQMRAAEAGGDAGSPAPGAPA